MEPARPVILAMEDDRSIGGLLEDLLGEEYRVEVRATGSAGLARLGVGGVDLVLLDLSLPDDNGLEVCRRLRAGGEDRRLPVILMTAGADDQERLAGLAAGADDYLAKPFDIEELLARVRGWVGDQSTRARASRTAGHSPGTTASPLR